MSLLLNLLIKHTL